MTKSELIAKVAEETGVSLKTVEKVFKSTERAVTEEVASGNSICFTGFGTFQLRNRGERFISKNALTGKDMTIPASKTVGFKVGAVLKRRVNK